MNTATYSIRTVALLTLVLLLGTARESVAQITFTEADLQARIGQRYAVQTFDATDLTGLDALVNATGANQTFDLSSATFEESSAGTVEYLAMPADVPGASNSTFENATYVIAISFENPDNEADSTAWAFYTLTNEGIEMNGIVFESTTDLDEDGQVPDEVTLEYIPALLSEALPLTYQSEWSGSTTMFFNVNGQAVISTDLAVDGIANGYGTLVLPGGEEIEVLRLDETDETTVFGFTSSTRTITFIAKNGTSAVLTLDDAGAVLDASYSVQESSPGTPVERTDEVPSAYSLRSNYPNPFNPTTAIEYALPSAGEVTLTVYDALGREVDQLVHERQAAGTYTVTFDAGDLPSGIYFYRLRAGSFEQIRQMTLIK